MTDENISTEVKQNVEEKSKPSFITIAIIIALVVFVIKDLDRAKGILIVLLGFGAIIFVHELGHFLAAKAVGIKAEEFAIGFGPVLLGWRKAKNAFQLRLLPKKHENAPSTAAYTMNFPSKSEKVGDTEYQLRAIPLGGFVKMLGQEDMIASDTSKDPRSYMNKSVWQRMIVISAGVIMNLITGFLAFMYVFHEGIHNPPAVVGTVAEGTPAYEAGLRSGDEFISINGKDRINDFLNLKVAAAFCDVNEKIPLIVRHPDGREKEYKVGVLQDTEQGFNIFGIVPATTLDIHPAKNIQGKDREKIIQELEGLSIHPGATITQLNGIPITTERELWSALLPFTGTASAEKHEITLEHEDENGSPQRNVLIIPMRLKPVGQTNQAVMELANNDRRGKISDLRTQILNMIPRRVITSVSKDSPAHEAGLQKGDVLYQIGTLLNPTHDEIQDYIERNANKKIAITILREIDGELEEKSFEITPKRPSVTWWKYPLLAMKGSLPDPVMGIMLEPDLEHPIIADHIASAKNASNTIPRGSMITHVNEIDVRNWKEIFDVLAVLKQESVTIGYKSNKDDTLKSATIALPAEYWTGLAYRPDSKAFTQLTKFLKPQDKLYKSENWIDSLRMGYDTTYSFIAQTYLTIKGMVAGNVSAKAMSGPIGILSMSYTIANERSAIWFVYFMAMISMCIAVFNFLPIPILDGGHMVMLAAEKIKGSPVSVKAQEAANWVGLGLIGCLFLYVTFNDIMRLVTG